MYVQWGASRASVLSTISHALILMGVVLAAVVGLRMAREALEMQAVSHTPLRIMQATPAIALAPLATPQSTVMVQTAATSSLALSAAPTIVSSVELPVEIAPGVAPASALAAKRDLLPPVRIAIPAIDINARINESPLETWTDDVGRARARWQDPGRAVGHLAGTALPGGDGNIVLTGHNNWMGEVFRRLPELHRGDEITLYTETGEYLYRVTERWIVPYRRDPARGKARLRSYTKNTSHEQLTLISCYPYLTNADRIVIIAEPMDAPESGVEMP